MAKVNEYMRPKKTEEFAKNHCKKLISGIEKYAHTPREKSKGNERSQARDLKYLKNRVFEVRYKGGENRKDE